MVLTGLDRLVSDEKLQNQFSGRVALLAHNASIDQHGLHAVQVFKRLFGDRFIKLFGPQHGFMTADQDNMIETDHAIHPYFRIPVYSLYSETRVPTDTMLQGIDHLFVDLQDIGSRMYTYAYTLTLLLEKCAARDIEVIILDRPNPINGLDVEGNVLDPAYASFIGRHPLPVRHGLTIGEVALMHQKFWATDPANLQVIPMLGWQRDMYYSDTQLPWALPSPNIARPESALIFPATVIWEGTIWSEGRGTTQPFEVFGHPGLEPYRFYDQLVEPAIRQSGLSGFTLRPVVFKPTFHKQSGLACGGFQVQVLDRSRFKPWRTGQFIMQTIFQPLREEFQWLEPPYEYVYDRLPIDIINGTDQIRHWIESGQALDELEAMEQLEDYLTMRNEVMLYRE